MWILRIIIFPSPTSDSHSYRQVRSICVPQRISNLSVQFTNWLTSSILQRVLHFFSHLFFFNPSCFSSLPDCLRRLCRPAPLLLLGSLHLDVPGRGAALYHAGGGFREWALQDQVLLPGRLWGSRRHRGCLRRSRLQELRHRSSVRTKNSAWGVYLCVFGVEGWWWQSRTFFHGGSQGEIMTHVGGYQQIKCSCFIYHYCIKH